MRESVSASVPVSMPAKVPAVFHVALAFWVSAAFIRTVPAVDPSASLAMATVSGVVLAGCIIALRHRPYTALYLLCGLALGVCVTAVYNIDEATAREAAEASPAADYTFQLVEDPVVGAFSTSAVAEVSIPGTGTRRVLLELPEDTDARCWDVIESYCGLNAPSADDGEYCRREGVCARVTVRDASVTPPGGVFGAVSAVRASAIEALTAYPGDGALLIRAMVLADRSGMADGDLYDTMRTVGLAHIVAVSGAHLVVIVSVLSVVLRLLRVPMRARVVISVGIIGIYLVFTGAPKSAIRAAVMCAAAIAATLPGRRTATLSALSLCVLCLVGFKPYLATSLSLTLSAAATAGIIMFGTYFSSWCSALFAGHMKPIADVMGMTSAVNLCTLGFTCPIFGMVPLVAPLSNLIVAPLFAIICAGGSVACVGVATGVPGTDALLGSVVGAADALCRVFELLARLPYACVPAHIGALSGLLITAVIVIALFRFRPEPTPAAARGCAVVFTVVLVIGVLMGGIGHGAEIAMLDVGQGDAIVVRDGTRAVMVDTGTDDAAVLDGLAEQDIVHLDALIITHPDDDHCGSAGAVLDAVEVDRVLVAADLLTCGCDNCSRLRNAVASAPVTGLHQGDVISLGAFTCTLLWPSSYACEGGNADSLVLDLSCDVDADGVEDLSALLCGDAEADTLNALDDRGALRRVDVLKVGHHGSGAALDTRVAEVLHPSIALVSVGADNRYGHPVASTLDLLRDVDARIARTDHAGSVVVRAEPDGMSIDVGALE